MFSRNLSIKIILLAGLKPQRLISQIPKPRLSIKIILLAGLKLLISFSWFGYLSSLSIKIILLAGLKHQINTRIQEQRPTALSIKIILLAGLKPKHNALVSVKKLTFQLK